MADKTASVGLDTARVLVAHLEAGQPLVRGELAKGQLDRLGKGPGVELGGLGGTCQAIGETFLRRLLCSLLCGDGFDDQAMLGSSGGTTGGGGQSGQGLAASATSSVSARSARTSAAVPCTDAGL